MTHSRLRRYHHSFSFVPLFDFIFFPVDSLYLLIKVSSSSWAEFVGPEVSQKLSEHEKQRQESIFELINTEQIYILDLQMIHHVCPPISDLKKKKKKLKMNTTMKMNMNKRPY